MGSVINLAVCSIGSHGHHGPERPSPHFFMTFATVYAHQIFSFHIAVLEPTSCADTHRSSELTIDAKSLFNGGDSDLKKVPFLITFLKVWILLQLPALEFDKTNYNMFQTSSLRLGIFLLAIR